VRQKKDGPGVTGICLTARVAGAMKRPMPKLSRPLCAVIAALALVSATAPVTPARAEPPPPASAPAPLSTGLAEPAATATEQSAVAERLTFLEDRFRDGNNGAKWWYNGWMGSTGALMLGGGIVGAVAAGKLNPDAEGKTRDLMEDAFVLAGTAFIGVLTLAIVPHPSAVALERLEAAQAEGYTAAERLVMAEELMVNAAKYVEFQRSWLTHAGGVLLGVGSGALSFFAFDNKLTGVLQMVGTVAVSEARIWTLPTRPTDDLAAYREKFHGLAEEGEPSAQSAFPAPVYAKKAWQPKEFVAGVQPVVVSAMPDTAAAGANNFGASGTGLGLKLTTFSF
jgi:hypothetical protein